MNDYVIVTDSATDLSAAQVEEMGVEILPLSFILGGEVYRNYPDHREMGIKEFYQKVREGAMATTSAINTAEYMEALEPILQGGKDALVLAFSSGLSTTCHSAFMAAEELSAKYPERKLYVVDTVAASMGQGLLVWHAVQKKKAGASIEEVRDWCQENRMRMCHWFTVDDLMHLKRGGRVSAATAVLGTMLSIKPVLHVDDEGHLISMAKARGRKASLNALVDKAAELGEDLEDQVIFISHSDCEEDARYVGDQMKARFGVKDVVYNFIGPVIGAHTGCGCVALFFLGKHH